jgi:tRNA 5-methylaminomethyl-2-thiouridine biosynthesis bifunctional protein
MEFICISYHMVLKSMQYDDVYFSAQDGLAETRHVFLDGNDLPRAWQGRDHFTIAETGFGTGLNFLAAWKLFEETRKEGQTLTYVSFEKHPLARETIDEALKGWNELAPQLEAFLKNYKPETDTVKITDRITLSLYIGDINDTLPSIEAHVDAWFLDGFKPSSNPAMWNETILNHVARLTRPQGTFATFTAAGFVRRTLEAAGFIVTKRKGFGRKREMLTGVKP